MLLNPLLVATGNPPIPEAQGWAARYDGAAGPMLDLCQAVPGYPPHPELLARLGEEAARRDAAKYGTIVGDLGLREAYAADMGTFHGGRIGADQVAITAGCNQAFFMAILAIAQRGDAVMLPTPWYWNHSMTLDMLGIDAIPLPCTAENGFVPDPERAAALWTPRTRAVVLITPNNPTGAIYPPEVIAGFAALCRERGATLLLDETYRDFLPEDAEQPHAVFADSDWSHSVIGLYSFSKSFCIPGHRLGALVADESVIAQGWKALDCLHICPQRGAQAAVAWAIPALRDWRDGNRAEINRRAAAMRHAVESVPGWRLDSLGAYFAYVRHPYGDTPGAQVAEELAARHGALCLPGSAFAPRGDRGQDGHLRLAFANLDLAGIAALPARLAALG
jgi:aspartate/methionine/tyrosine aminotransferase